MQRELLDLYGHLQKEIQNYKNSYVDEQVLREKLRTLLEKTKKEKFERLKWEWAQLDYQEGEEESLTFLFAANKGEAPASLKDQSSGGEVVRFADHHLHVSKKECNGRTLTEITPLYSTEKDQEIFRMLVSNCKNQ